MFSMILESIIQEPEQSVQALTRKLSRPHHMPTVAGITDTLESSDAYEDSTTSDFAGVRSKTPSVSSAETESFSDTEVELRCLWSQILSLPADNIERTGNFFELGGNSIRAMRLVNKAREASLLIAVADVFKTPVLTDLAHAVSRMSVEESVAAKDLSSSPSTPLAMHRITELAKHHPVSAPTTSKVWSKSRKPRPLCLP